MAFYIAVWVSKSKEVLLLKHAFEQFRLLDEHKAEKSLWLARRSAATWFLKAAEQD